MKCQKIAVHVVRQRECEREGYRQVEHAENRVYTPPPHSPLTGQDNAAAYSYVQL